jgi:outer membrane protein OmpA-like peptidoglycan-associated protein
MLVRYLSEVLSRSMKFALVALMLLMVEARAQEKPSHPVPLFVSHLSEQNKVLLYRKGAPKHTIFSKALCFKKKCRGFIGWRTHQQNRRFKGWEDKRTPEQKRRKKQPAMPLDTLFTPAPIAKVNPTFKKEENASVAPAKTKEVFVLDDVLFEINSYRLNERHTSGLDSLVEILAKNPAIQIQINGHTDNSGNERYNLKLSRDRAEAVAIYLIDHTIEESRIAFEGYGSSRPLVSNETEEGRRKNRRVEIIMTR